MPTWLKAVLHGVAYVIVLLIGVGIGAAGQQNGQHNAASNVTTTTAVRPSGQPAVTTQQPTAAQPAGPKNGVTDGTFQVGMDIAAGRWKTDGPASPGGNCYWERERTDSGDFSAIIANDNTSGPSSISVNAGEFVKFNGGCTWSHS